MSLASRRAAATAASPLPSTDPPSNLTDSVERARAALALTEEAFAVASVRIRELTLARDGMKESDHTPETWEAAVVQIEDAIRRAAIKANWTAKRKEDACNALRVAEVKAALERDRQATAKIVAVVEQLQAEVPKAASLLAQPLALAREALTEKASAATELREAGEAPAAMDPGSLAEALPQLLSPDVFASAGAIAAWVNAAPDREVACERARREREAEEKRLQLQADLAGHNGEAARAAAERRRRELTRSFYSHTKANTGAFAVDLAPAREHDPFAEVP